MTSPGHKKVSHMGFFRFHEPSTIFRLLVLYSTYLRVISLRNARTTLSCRVLWGRPRVRENAKTHVPYLGCMVMVCAIILWKLRNRATAHFTNPTTFFTGYTTKYQIILKWIPSERRESVLSYCLIFFPKLHKIDLEITVSKRAVFKTRLSRNRLFFCDRARWGKLRVRENYDYTFEF